MPSWDGFFKQVIVRDAREEKERGKGVRKNFQEKAEKVSEGGKGVRINFASQRTRHMIS